MAYKSYTHVERLGTVDTEGILNGVCYITAKVDGTNAVVWYEKDQLCAGSRTRQLSENKDNAGFYNWVRSEAPQVKALEKFCKAYPHYLVYGEWLGSSKFVGHIKDYNADALGHLWIFDVYDQEQGTYLPELTWRALLNDYDALVPYCVELLSIVKNPSEETLEQLLTNNAFLLDNANHAGEGIVIKNPDFVNVYGRPCYAKIVREEFKAEKSRKRSLQCGEVEKDIIEIFVTDSEMSKAVAKTAAYFDSDFERNGKMIGYYLNLVFNDCICEECPHWVKKFKHPKVDFKVLKALCTEKAKHYIGL